MQCPNIPSLTKYLSQGRPIRFGRHHFQWQLVPIAQRGNSIRRRFGNMTSKWGLARMLLLVCPPNEKDGMRSLVCPNVTSEDTEPNQVSSWVSGNTAETIMRMPSRAT